MADKGKARSQTRKVKELLKRGTEVGSREGAETAVTVLSEDENRTVGKGTVVVGVVCE